MGPLGELSVPNPGSPRSAWREWAAGFPEDGWQARQTVPGKKQHAPEDSVQSCQPHHKKRATPSVCLRNTVEYTAAIIQGGES
jgi:hypothetical protein